MHIQYCFPTAIFSTINEQLADQLLPMAKTILNDSKFMNYDLDYKSTYNPHFGLENIVELQSFKQYISDIGKTFLKKQGYKIKFNNFDSHIFMSEMFKGDYHIAHSHPNSILSGVFYLQTPEGSSPIVFYDPKLRKNFIFREKEFETDSTRDDITVHPKKGLLMMWESWLSHSVPKCSNEKEGRVTIVFNLFERFE